MIRAGARDPDRRGKLGSSVVVVAHPRQDQHIHLGGEKPSVPEGYGQKLLRDTPSVKYGYCPSPIISCPSRNFRNYSAIAETPATLALFQVLMQTSQYTTC